MISLKRIINIIKHPGSILHPNDWSNEVFIDYIKSMGAEVGEGTRFISPTQCHFDINRADYIKIGNNCCLSYVSILAHDYSWYTLLRSKSEILPDPGGMVIIGNNCFIGYQALILKDTIIGDNVIIGARSVVKGNIPPNTVWAGVPAKQLCTLDEFFERKYKKRLKDALYRFEHVKKLRGRIPTIEEMGWFAFLFLERTQENYDKYIKSFEFNGIVDCSMVKEHFFSSVNMFASYDDFINKIQDMNRDGCKYHNISNI